MKSIERDTACRYARDARLIYSDARSAGLIVEADQDEPAIAHPVRRERRYRGNARPAAGSDLRTLERLVRFLAARAYGDYQCGQAGRFPESSQAGPHMATGTLCST